MQYITHLSRDKTLGRIIRLHGPVKLEKRRNIFMHLCASIISQQLSVKVAAVIEKRFLNLYGGKVPLPQQVLNTELEALRSIGLSNAKASYVKNIADFAIKESLDFKLLGKMENEDLINYLTRIKGVGRWTAEMQLIFTLGREDVFAVDDLGIQIAMADIYKLKTDDRKKLKEKMLLLSAPWAPYRSYACLHLWKYKDSI
jgi:DNA-3-methyladenine glycosylase II